MRLGVREIYDAALAAGFTPDQATTWTAIALAESRGETGALNDSGEHSIGLWQINVAAHGDRFGDLTAPYVNARAAYEISHHGTDMRPWTTTHSSHAGSASDYRTYLDDVSAVTGYAGDPRGVGGYDSPLPPPLPASGVTPGFTTATGYDQIDAGMSPLASLDSDHDGLTDAFELAVGSSPSVADTDADGLSDAYEYAVSHTRVLMADTDLDGVGDAAEAALGTMPTPAGDLASSDPGGAPVTGSLTSTRAMSAGATSGMSAPGMPGAAMSAVGKSSSAGTATSASGATRADAFVQAALAQRGDSYVFGAETPATDVNPDAFDCSELTQWAAEQAGVTIPDGSYAQYLDLKAQGRLVSVDDALHTKGALLFYFSSEPQAGGGRPAEAHVAISLGDGRTIEARGTSYGVNVFPATDRFNYAGVIPQMGEVSTLPLMQDALLTYDAIDAGTSPEFMAQGFDSDGDGLSDAFERLVGLDPLHTDSDLDGVPDAVAAMLGTAGTTGGVATIASIDPSGDVDADGLSNAFEVAHGLDPSAVDSDLDGLWDSYESVLGTDPLSVDTDHDGLTDALEAGLGLDPLVPGGAGGSSALPPDAGLGPPDLDLGPG